MRSNQAARVDLKKMLRAVFTVLCSSSIMCKKLETMMKSHLYRVTIEHLEDSKGNATESIPLIFETRHHEDIFKIVETMKGKVDFDEADAMAFAVGLKLFSGVLLKNKDDALFEQFKPHFADFMKALKKV